MVELRLAGVLFILGIILDGVGLVPLFFAEDIELNGGRQMTVPDGVESYAYIEVDMGGGGPIEGTFECLNGTSVWLMVMDEDQFSAFTAGLDDESRTSVSGSSGEFSVEQVDMVVCYIVVQHSPGVETDQAVSVEYTVTNTDFAPILISMAVMMVGATMMLLAFHSRQRAVNRARAAQKKDIDVVFFDE